MESWLINVFTSFIQPRTVFLLLIFFYAIQAFPQPLTFNNTLLFKDTIFDETANQVLSVDGGFLLCGESDYAAKRLVIARIDRYGLIIWKKNYGNLNIKYRPGFFNSMIWTNDSNIALAASYTDTVNTLKSRIILMKFNPDGDTLWSKLLYQPADSSYACYAHGLIQTNDHGFLVFGEDNSVNGVLVKTDSAGNKEWITYLGNSSYTNCRYITSVCQTRDSGFMVGDHKYNIYNDKSGDPVVVRYDREGTKLWERLRGGEYEDLSYTFIKPLNDSLYVVINDYTINTSGPPYYEPLAYQLEITVMNDNFEVISDTLIGNPDMNLTLTAFEVLKDGTYLATGNTWDYKSWMLNFDLERYQRFFRMINIPGEKDIDYLSELDDILHCDDGGILACGSYNELYNGTNHYKPWLIKTDRFGCFEMGCDSNAIYLLNQSGPDSTCINEIAQVTVETFNSVNNEEYSWQNFKDGIWQNIVDPIVYQGINNDTLIIKSALIPGESELYRCNFYNDFWSFYSDSTQVTFLDTLNILEQPGSVSVNYGEQSQFHVNATGNTPIDYIWYHNATPIDGVTGNDLVIQSVMEKDTGTYYCKMTNLCGDLESDHVILRIKNLGIEESDSKQIIVSPNPVSGILQIRVTGYNSLNSIALYDITGRVQNPGYIRNDLYNYQLDLSSVSQGIYFLIISLDKNVIIRKIMKNYP